MTGDATSVAKKGGIARKNKKMVYSTGKYGCKAIGKGKKFHTSGKNVSIKSAAKKGKSDSHQSRKENVIDQYSLVSSDGSSVIDRCPGVVNPTAINSPCK